VIAEFRRRIVAGPWPPGTRIPTKRQLCREFAASDGTIQKTLDALSAEGFLYSRGRLGTFVADHPPFLSQVGLVFPGPTRATIWYDAFTMQAERMDHAGGHRIRCYANCGSTSGPGSEGLEALINDVLCERLAGTPVLDHPRLARVVIGGVAGAAKVPAVGIRPAYPRAMEHFRARGRRRLGIVTTYSYYRQMGAVLRSARAHGLLTRRRWTHFFDVRSDITARAVTELMMSLSAADRPDALYVMDDHLVSQATAGVADAGRRAPGEVDVVAQCNFPYIQSAAVPVTYLGVNVPEVLTTALAMIDRQAAGRPVPPVTWLTQRFEHELPPG